MREQTRDAANITNPEHAQHHIVSPLECSFAFITLLTGTAITVLAATLNIGIFNPALRLRSGIALQPGQKF